MRMYESPHAAATVHSFSSNKDIHTKLYLVLNDEANSDAPLPERVAGCFCEPAEVGFHAGQNDRRLFSAQRT